MHGCVRINNAPEHWGAIDDPKVLCSLIKAASYLENLKHMQVPAAFAWRLTTPSLYLAQNSYICRLSCNPRARHKMHICCL